MLQPRQPIFDTYSAIEVGWMASKSASLLTNGSLMDSYNSSDLSQSLNGFYTPTTKQDRGGIALSSSTGKINIGATTNANKVYGSIFTQLGTTSAARVFVSSNGAVGDTTYVDAGGANLGTVQERHFNPMVMESNNIWTAQTLPGIANSAPSTSGSKYVVVGGTDYTLSSWAANTGLWITGSGVTRIQVNNNVAMGTAGVINKTNAQCKLYVSGTFAFGTHAQGIVNKYPSNLVIIMAKSGSSFTSTNTVASSQSYCVDNPRGLVTFTGVAGGVDISGYAIGDVITTATNVVKYHFDEAITQRIT